MAVSKKPVSKVVATSVKKVVAQVKKATPVPSKAVAKPMPTIKKAVPSKAVAPVKKAATPVAKVVAVPAKKAAAPVAKVVATPAKKAAAPVAKVVAAPAKKAAAPIAKVVATPAKKPVAPVKQVITATKTAPKTTPAKTTVAKVTAKKGAEAKKPVVEVKAAPPSRPARPRARVVNKEPKIKKEKIDKNKRVSTAKRVEVATGIKLNESEKRQIAELAKKKLKKPQRKQPEVYVKKPVKESLPREITPSNILPTRKTFQQMQQENRRQEMQELADRKNIEIPKTTAQGKVNYNPNYANSVLDAKTVDLPITNVRYNDSELAEFRELIIRKIESARKELNYLQGLITRKDGNGDLDDGRYMTMEDGTISMEREQLSQMASRQIQFIDHLEKALVRIENKTYGICRVTGKLIDKARLRAVPHATLSLEAKMSKA